MLRVRVVQENPQVFLPFGEKEKEILHLLFSVVLPI
jgi:hypothetical protein